MPGPVVDAVETILNKLTDGLHETTRLNRYVSCNSWLSLNFLDFRRPIRQVDPDPVDLLSLRDKEIEIDFLDAYHPESESMKTAAFIDRTLDAAAQLIIKMNEGEFFYSTVW